MADTDDTVTISTQEYEKLKKDSAFLNALEAWGSITGTGIPTHVVTCESNKRKTTSRIQRPPASGQKRES